jgi:hypothetical protein
LLEDVAMRNLLAGIAAVAALALAGSAHATLYTLDQDGCSSGCGLTSYGTVTTTGEGTTSIHFVVSLDAGVFFNQAGTGHDSFAWNLAGDPTITVSGLPSTFVTNGSQDAGTHHENGFGDFGYIVDWIGPPTNNGTLGVQSLTFDITSSSILTLEPNDLVFMTVDITRGPDGPTGVIGGTLCVDQNDCGENPGGGPVPEPATWAMMLIGFGGMGAILRHNRRRSRMAFA